MEKQIDENKVILETLERLKRNKDYQYLCSHLSWINETLVKMVFDESIDIKDKQALIIRSNSIKLFLELPKDLIEQFTPIEN